MLHATDVPATDVHDADVHALMCMPLLSRKPLSLQRARPSRAYIRAPAVVTGTPLAVVGKEDSEIHHTIAELMILANSAVAEKIEGVFPSSALVRIHAAPDSSRLTAFQDVAEKAGVTRGQSSKQDKGGGKGGAFC